MKWKTELKEQFQTGMDCLRSWCRLPPWTSVGQMCFLVWFDVCSCVRVHVCLYVCLPISGGFGGKGGANVQVHHFNVEQMSGEAFAQGSICLMSIFLCFIFSWRLCVCYLTHMKNLHDVITEMSSVTVRFVAQLSKGFNWVVSMLYLKNLWCELWQAQILNVGHFVLLPEHPCSVYKVIRHEH